MPRPLDRKLVVRRTRRGHFFRLSTPTVTISGGPYWADGEARRRALLIADAAFPPANEEPDEDSADVHYRTALVVCRSVFESLARGQPVSTRQFAAAARRCDDALGPEGLAIDARTKWEERKEVGRG